jgi:hypothetical protein
LSFDRAVDLEGTAVTELDDNTVDSAGLAVVKEKPPKTGLVLKEKPPKTGLVLKEKPPASSFWTEAEAATGTVPGITVLFD